MCREFRDSFAVIRRGNGDDTSTTLYAEPRPKPGEAPG